MTRELLILRHGKSDWEAGTDDFHRPLKDRGKRGAQRAGVWLLQQGLLPDHVVSSPAERASVTAQKACKAMGMNARIIHREPAVYEAMTGDLLQVLADCPASAQRVLLVGHNPGLEELLIYLAHESIPYPADGKLLPTATLARLAMPDDWRGLHAGSAELLAITRPAELPKKFPFPFPDGPERRDRPAYYYTQSSVIPYRLQDGQPQILIVSSSQRKHWVVPKGIRDPGLSPQELANATYPSQYLPSGSVTLENGRFSEPIAPGSATEIKVQVTRHLAYGELNGQPAAALVLVSQPGGSGSFYDLHVMVSQNIREGESVSSFLVILLRVNRRCTTPAPR